MTIIQEEDRKIIHDYIICNLTIRILQREIKDAETLNVKIKRVYVSANRYQECQALKQLKELRKKMNERGLRIIGEHRVGRDIIEFRFLCRGVPSHICLQEKDLSKFIEEKQLELLR
ncbi:hypothetical protein [Domibacillus iocasae]|uniref:Uncharacterized protein n=1 Tax=Domibacillus iocasae TaxID=1714016 RepID=A0A1E7DQM2_9BACI|nr:hypothetical protein [Domibacillus iocasae]OES45354.1 hypothetical protein BA724_04950 [Domibacillus iocasae]